MTDEEIQVLRDELKAVEQELDGLKAEKEALAGEQESRNNRITELEMVVSEKDSQVAALRQTVADDNQKLEVLNESLSQAVATYKTVVVEATPGVVEELITGNTITEINQSLENAKTILAKVREGIEEEIAHEIASGKVPAGAPVRAPLDLSALSPREKIQYAIGGKR